MANKSQQINNKEERLCVLAAYRETKSEVLQWQSQLQTELPGRLKKYLPEIFKVKL